LITVGGFNTSLDKALDLEVLEAGAVNRARDARPSPGGKGLHVAATIAALGEPVCLVGLIDATHRRLFEDRLGARGVEFHGVEGAHTIRTCLAIHEGSTGRVTEILEPGPVLDADTRGELSARFLSMAGESALAILSGSLPRGFGEDTYAGLVKTLRNAAVRCLVDASGGLLRAAVAARPFLIKPNRDEIEALTGASVEAPEAALAAARGLAAGGVAVVIVSLGAAGAVLSDGGRAWHAWVPALEVRNPVGSGDCLLGGVAVGLARGLDLEGVVRLGVACGTANALSDETGWVRPDDIDAVLPRVRCHEVV
jgi:tagatose 6-phosphate kinase